MRLDRSKVMCPGKKGAFAIDWRHVPLHSHIEQYMNFVSGSAPYPNPQLTGEKDFSQSL